MRTLIALSALVTLMPPAAEAFWGKYGSFREAWTACFEWTREPSQREMQRGSASIYCWPEKETRQVMAMHKQTNAGKTNEKVLKRFRY